MEVEEDEDANVEPTDAVSAAGTELTKQTESTSVEGIVLAPASHETIPAIHSYQIKPVLADKFKAGTVKEIIRNALGDKLSGKAYEADKVKKWTVDLANEISSKVTELKMKRYKHIVQVILGEHKGAGVKSGVRCLWDSETDGYTSEIFSNDTIFCLVVVYAVYLY
ncbi:hypothetical protein MTP99_013787 [Tenebrio molitor]|jgi:tryptophan 2,3-dioxygenase|uniref:dynein light chain Tctex-type protein 2B-like n=1 Tax=Tenebrio molitor TaxID=7067 RepID=UPI0026FE9933|nr:hypothetical protein MTP99_013787 [Tenebrio molitor]